MASKGENTAPIIIKRKKIIQVSGGHGGAWKVAYADFVTAMMAFFLLMWLLNATTEKQRKGIADYFNPTIPINRVSGGGDGTFGGDSVFSEDQQVQSGTGASNEKPMVQRQARGSDATDSGRADNERADNGRAGGRAGEDDLRRVAETIERTLTGRSGESMASDRLARRIVTRLTDEGLIVEFFDIDGEPLFVTDRADPEPILDEIAQMLTRVFSIIDNKIAINGFVYSYPKVVRIDPSWELSAQRADVMRERLQAAGFPAERVLRLTGFADKKPAVDLPMSIRNNRLEVILLRKGV